MGDVFGMTQRTADELWEGDARGEAFRAVEDAFRAIERQAQG